MSIRTIAIGAALIAAAQARDAAASNSAACIPGFDYAAFGKDSVKVGGNSISDAFSSTLGAYGGANVSNNGNLGTNGDACDVINTNGSSVTIGGSVKYGSTGSACSVDQGPSTITGTQSALPSDMYLPSINYAADFPATVGTDQGDISGNNTLTPTTNNTWGNVDVGNGKTLTLGAGTYVFDSMTVKGEVKVTGAVVIYFKCQSNSEAITMNAGGILNAQSPQKPTNLIIFMGSACATAKLTGGANSGFAVYAPDTVIDVNGGSDIYGAIVGKTVDLGGGVDIHYDQALQDFNPPGYTCPVEPQNEVSRSAPVVAAIGGTTAVVQGTFEVPLSTSTSITNVGSIATWTFPDIKGHMRARAASTITTTASNFSSGTILFDAGATGKIPAANNAGCTALNGSCRNVFTITSTPDSTGVQFHPTKVQLNDTNASTIGALIASTTDVVGITATEWQTIVRKVIAGKLGGVDRSTVAVIEPSTLISGTNASRPTMAYFGATDGMLHAVCASTGGNTVTQSSVCPSLGTELWAFIPRTQLPKIRTNTARIDGSVRVIDAFGDFTNNPATGTKSWRTILLFQTGNGAATYALDVTDPATPVILWEYTTPSSPGAQDLGAGLTVAAGSVRISNKSTNLAVFQTNNGGSGSAGVVAKAVSLETGAPVWSFGYTYPSPPRGISADNPLPTTGIPGGAVPVDLTGNGFITDFVFGDLYGNLWRLDATNGTSRNGTNTPLFSFSSNKKPIGAAPAIYSNGSQYAAFSSGGYVDPTAASWVSGQQYLMAVKLNSTASTIDETGSASTSGPIGIKVALSANHKGFSQALVVGTSLVLSTDSTDVNSSSYGTSTSDTGEVTKVDLTGATATSVIAMSSGGTALANSGTTLYSSSSSKQQQVSTAGTTGGTKVDIAAATGKVVRALWLRTE